MAWKDQVLEWSKTHPVEWMQKVLGGTLWSKQREIANSLVENERTAVPACFSAGKTWLAARLAIWFLYTHTPSKVITSAPTGRQVKNLLWAELRTAHKQSKIRLGGSPLTLQLDLSSDHFAVGFSTKDYDIDKFTGYHAPHVLVIFDQAGGLPQMFWEAGEGLMTSSFVRWLAIGNTAIPEGAFGDICESGRTSKYGDWKVIKIRAAETPNIAAGRNIYPGLLPHNWLEDKLRIWGKDDPLFRVFAEAEFVASIEKVVVSAVYVAEAYRLAGEYSDKDTIEVGLDVARGGMDSTVWVARLGSKVLEIHRITGNTTMEVVGETVRFKRYLEGRYKRKVTTIRLDAIGIGAGVYDRLNELEGDEELPIVPVINSEAASDPFQFANIRAEMAWALRNRFEAGGVGLAETSTSDPECLDFLRTECTTMRYKITSSGKIILWLKEEIKKLIKRSPDYWDALVMAFEEPGGGAAMVSFFSTGGDAYKHTPPPQGDNVVVASDLFGSEVDFDEAFIEM